MSIRKPTLRDVAIKQNREKILHSKENETPERTLLIIGSKNSGKTTIINQLVQKERASSATSSTYLLEYRYARQSARSLMKDVCHIWELGSGITFISLLSVILKENHSVTVALVLDLTAPETILSITETLLDTIKRLMVESYANKENPVQPVNTNVEEEDRPYLDPFPVQLVIIGGKYDVFQNLEPSKKRIVCQYLRCLSHILQADLLFYSYSDTKLMKNVRDFLLSYAFNVPVNKNVIVTDYNKPLRIPAGCDSFRNIQGTGTTANFTLDKYRNSLIAHLNQEVNKQEQLPDDPATDTNFLELAIDNLWRQKTEELKRIQEENRRRAVAVQSRK